MAITEAMAGTVNTASTQNTANMVTPMEPDMDMVMVSILMTRMTI